MITKVALNRKFGFRRKNPTILMNRRNKGRHNLIPLYKFDDNSRKVSFVTRRIRRIQNG